MDFLHYIKENLVINLYSIYMIIEIDDTKTIGDIQDKFNEFFPFLQRTRALPATAMQMCKASETRSAAYLAACSRAVNHAATATNAAL